MSDVSLMYWQDKLYKGTPRVLLIQYEITAAKTVSPLIAGVPVYTFFDAITQSNIDTFLGTSSEFTAAKFDAVAMGADAFGFIVDMKNQVESFLSMTARCYSTAGGATLVERAIKQAGLTDSTLATECAKSTLGNIAGRIDFGNVPDFDGLTSGLIELELKWISK